MNGQNAAPVFTYLKEKQGGFITNAIKWNFSKFLVKNGIVRDLCLVVSRGGGMVEAPHDSSTLPCPLPSHPAHQALRPPRASQQGRGRHRRGAQVKLWWTRRRTTASAAPVVVAPLGRGCSTPQVAVMDGRDPTTCGAVRLLCA